MYDDLLSENQLVPPDIKKDLHAGQTLSGET
jgi:hypothetical protein